MRYIFILILLAGSIKVYGQNSLSGKVIDMETKSPIIGATIYLPDLKKGTNTDLEGSFQLTYLPRGNFLVEARYLGYNSKVFYVTISGETKVDITLSGAVTELHEVVVTGVSSATELKRNPVPTKIVGKEALIESSATNIVDAISRQPGVSQISTGQAISKPIIRGLGYNRIISLYNGIRQEGQQWGDEHGMEIDEYSIEKVEIVKGPGSLMYGSDGIGGVVNFRSPEPLPDGKITGSLTTNYQSNNNLMAISGMNSGTINGISWLVRASGKKAGNFSNKYDGKVYNSGFRETDFNGFVGVHKKWGYSQLHFASFNQKIAMPEGDRDETGKFIKPLTDSTEAEVTDRDLKGFKIGIPNQYVRHTRLYLTNNFLLGESRLMVNVGYQLNRRQEFGEVSEPDQYGLYFYLQTVNYDVKYFLPEINGWKTSIGINGMYQQNQNKGIEFLIPDYSLFDAGAYVFVQKYFNKLNLSGGLRYDLRNIKTESLFLDDEEMPTNPSNEGAEEKFSALNKNFSNYSGSIGATYNFSDQFFVKSNISRGFRAPNIAELSSNGQHEGTLRYELGSPNLKPETSFQYDLGMVYSGTHVSVEADVFSNQINNYIYATRVVEDGNTYPISDVPLYQFGHKDATLSGGEFTVDIHPHPLDWLHFQNSFSIVRGTVKDQPDSSKYLPFMPAPRYQSEIRANAKKLGTHLARGFVRIGLDHYFKQNQYLKENKTETATSGYTLINAGFGTDVTYRGGKTIFTLLFTASNIFGVAYQSHLSRLKYAPENPVTNRVGIYNMGRNLSAKLIVPIDFR